MSDFIWPADLKPLDPQPLKPLEFLWSGDPDPLLEALVEAEYRRSHLLIAAKRASVLGPNSTPWSGGHTCCICDKPLTNCDSLATCPKHNPWMRELYGRPLL